MCRFIKRPSCASPLPLRSKGPLHGMAPLRTGVRWYRSNYHVLLRGFSIGLTTMCHFIQVLWHRYAAMCRFAAQFEWSKSDSILVQTSTLNFCEIC